MLLAQSNTAVAQTASGTTTATTSEVVTTQPQLPIVSSSVLTTAQQKRVTNLAANVSNKLDATTIRLTNIVLRMEARMRIMEQEGMDISSVRTQLDAAKSELETTRVTLKNIDTEVARVTSSEKPQQEWLRVRTTFTNTNASLQQTKQILQSALNALKGAQPRSIPTPQTSTTTSAQ
jgi:predicted  nucleic acid-binding Zn-ribbon protein